MKKIILQFFNYLIEYITHYYQINYFQFFPIDYFKIDIDYKHNLVIKQFVSCFLYSNITNI